jgi:hypothetical protein
VNGGGGGGGGGGGAYVHLFGAGGQGLIVLEIIQNSCKASLSMAMMTEVWDAQSAQAMIDDKPHALASTVTITNTGSATSTATGTTSKDGQCCALNQVINNIEGIICDFIVDNPNTITEITINITIQP